MGLKKFTGGYRFKRYVGKPSDELVSLEIPTKAIIPLAQGFGNFLKSSVKVGDLVQAGQIIARDDSSISSPIHAAISGKVIAIEKRNYFKREVEMVLIEGDGREDYRRLEGYSAQWEKLPAEKIEELLYLSGVTSLDREGIPTRFNSSIIMPDKVDDLIIHAAGSEAFNPSVNLLLSGKNIFNFIDAIKILKKVMPNAKVHLAINCKKKELIERIRKLTSSMDYLILDPVEPKYPQGYDEVLIPALIGKKFPYGYSAANIGAVVLNVQAVQGVWDAVVEGKPLIERTLILAGESFNKNLHVRVRVGTPLEFILHGRLKDGLARIILNSLLTGSHLNDLSLPVDRTFSQIIAIPEDTERKLLSFMTPGLSSDSNSASFLSAFVKARKKACTNRYGDERACIQCGYCIEVCPVRIIPTLINRQAGMGINETLMQYGIFNCIDCNLCSFVCPSKIPLAKHIKDAKAKLIDTGCDHSLCILPKFDLIGLDEYKGAKLTR